jgi:NADPH2:quinone reductase
MSERTGCNRYRHQSSPAKKEFARKNGCAHVLNLAEPGWEHIVREITGGAGVPVVYDSIGKDTFLASLDCLRPRGLMVSYGNASGPVSPLAPSILASKGSLFLTRPVLAHYTGTAEALQAAADELFAAVQSGAVTVAINQRFALKDAARAHDLLAARKTIGATVLLV